MSEKIKKKDLKDAVSDLKSEHPTLPERLGQYRQKRSSYEAKRMAHPPKSAPASQPAPAGQGAHRELRG